MRKRFFSVLCVLALCLTLLPVTAGAKETITVKLHANTGSDENYEGTMADQIFICDVAKALAPNAFTRTGYTFAGWSTTPAGGVVYEDGQKVVNLTSEENGIVTLYAQWNPNISIDVTATETSAANGATVSWTVTVENTSSAAVNDISVQVDLPVEFLNLGTVTPKEGTSWDETEKNGRFLP